MQRRLNLAQLLAIAMAAILLATAGVGWDMTRRYGGLVYDFNARNAQAIVDAGVADLAWREYAQAVAEIGRQIAQGAELRTGLGQKDVPALESGLKDEFGRAAISSGEIKALGLSVYDTSMALIAESWRGQPAAIPDTVRDAVAKREGAARLKLTWHVWRDGDEPRLSVFVPVGGMKVIGYVGVHADPLHALATLDERLGMAVEVLATSDRRVLVNPANLTIPDTATVRESMLFVHGPDGEILADLKVRQDVTDLDSALDSTALWSFAIFAVIGGGIAVGSVGFVALVMRRVRRREEAAAAELEAQRRQQEAAELDRQRSEGETDERRRSELLRLADTFEASVKTVVDALSRTSTDATSSAEVLSGVAQRASGLAATVANASDEASVNVQTVAAASEELSGSISEIGRQVTQSTLIARKAVEEAQETTLAMQGLADAAQKIGDVVKLINAIAGQTNLLALNATIEAARAGDAGKGFAVVASEVKSLANQTAKATEDIAAQVGAIQSSTSKAVSAIQRIDGTIGEISAVATTIAAAIEEQGAATQEIARNVQQAANGTRDVATTIGGVKEAASETGSVASMVLNSSRDLSRQAETLHREVDGFLATVRAT